jgi:hypothetical protein
MKPQQQQAPIGLSQGPQWSHWSQPILGERPSEDPRALEIWGYVDRPSYAVGEQVAFHVSTSAERFDLLIYRDGAEQEVVHHAEEIPGGWHPTPEDAYAKGCGWPVATSVEIGPGWRPGAYVVELVARDGRGTAVQDGFFVVRPEQPGRAPIAVVLATYTWQSYNDWGGGSAYSRNPSSSDPEAAPTELSEAQRIAGGFAPRLSFARPWARGLIRLPQGAPRIAMKHPPREHWVPRQEQGEWAHANGYSYWSGSAGWGRYDGLFVRWAERSGYPIELLSQSDLDRDPGCLDGYACVVTVGHDEYWTARGRQVLDRYVERGGRYVRLAGNILWQVRIEDDGTTQVCHKYVPETDPLAEADDRGQRSGAFESLAIDDPPVTTFGASGMRGGYARMGGSSPRGIGGLVVYRNDHWVFEGTDLYYGDVLGAEVPLVGYEVDGVDYGFEHGLPVATGDDGAPPGLLILALTPAGLDEEDHGAAGAYLPVGDGDVTFAARARYGEDTPEHRERVRRGCAVMTWMGKGEGEVVCCGTTEWPYALSQGEPAVERVVRNVLDRFSAT